MSAQYDWESSSEIGRVAIAATVEFLNSPFVNRHFFQLHSLHSVEQDPVFQKQGIDLLWNAPINGCLDEMTIEVKGDRNHNSGNFFLETISDVARNTKGAFLACKADWYFYYFVNSEVLYCIPTKLTQHWFVKNRGRFDERETSSRHGMNTWRTIGSLVPISILIEEVGCVPHFQRLNQDWQKHLDEHLFSPVAKHHY